LVSNYKIRRQKDDKGTGLTKAGIKPGNEELEISFI
jgi:hypothetical protein